MTVSFVMDLLESRVWGLAWWAYWRKSWSLEEESEDEDWSSGARCGAAGQGRAGDDDAAGDRSGVDYLFTWPQRHCQIRPGSFLAGLLACLLLALG